MIPSKLRTRKIAIITINILKIILGVPANAIKIQKEKLWRHKNRKEGVNYYLL